MLSAGESGCVSVRLSESLRRCDGQDGYLLAAQHGGDYSFPRADAIPLSACLWPSVPVLTIDRHKLPANHQMRQQAGHEKGGKGPMQQRTQKHDEKPHVS